jgi:hypothetical protein
MFSAAVITDRNGSLDWVVLGCARFDSAEQVWGEPATDGAVLRWDGDRVAEMIVEALCSRCDGTTDGFLIGTGFDEDLAALRLCDGCAFTAHPTEMLRWVPLSGAAGELGVPVRLADADRPDRAGADQAGTDRDTLAVLDDLEAAIVADELRARITDPAWRDRIARVAAANPQVVVAVAAAVSALSDVEVLDLYPGLAELGRRLPRSATKWLESSGPVAAARLGLPCLGAGA